MLARYTAPYSSYVLSRPLSPIGERFLETANSYAEVLYYYQNRVAQTLCCGISLVSLEEYNWGCCACFHLDKTKDQTYYSIYVYASHQDEGKFSEWLHVNPDKVIATFIDSKIEKILQEKGHPYRVIISPHTEWIEYKVIQSFFGSHCAKRTSVLFINHVEEGLWILRSRNASELAERAFLLHPVLQTDDEFIGWWERMNVEDNEKDWIHDIDRRVLALVIEYRSFANAYLSAASPDEEPTLSPLCDVNHMLIADKIQNRKDFERFHKDSHANSARLDQYFKQWLRALTVSEEEYTNAVTTMKQRVTPRNNHQK